MGLALQWASGLETRGVQGDQLLWGQPCLPCTWGAQTRRQALSTLALPAATYGSCGEWSLGGWPRGHTDPGACHRMPKSATGVLKCPWPCTECSLVSVTHPEGRLWCQASAACNARESVETMGPPGSWWVQQMDQGHNPGAAVGAGVGGRLAGPHTSSLLPWLNWLPLAPPRNGCHQAARLWRDGRQPPGPLQPPPGPLPVCGACTARASRGPSRLEAPECPPGLRAPASTLRSRSCAGARRPAWRDPETTSSGWQCCSTDATCPAPLGSSLRPSCRKKRSVSLCGAVQHSALQHGRSPAWPLRLAARADNQGVSRTVRAHIASPLHAPLGLPWAPTHSAREVPQLTAALEGTCS